MRLSLLVSLLALAGCTAKGDDTAADDSSSNVPPPEAPPLVINEFLASNTMTNADEAGEYDDWAELYNNGDHLVNFDGLYLTDNLDVPTKWPLPSGSGLDAGEYLLIWCDGSTDQGAHHASFKISRASGVLALFLVVDGADPVRVDGINYEAQEPDTSAARVPDGSDNWLPGQTPTPGASNGG